MTIERVSEENVKRSPDMSHSETLYTVLRPNGSVAARGCTVTDAADTVLSDDGCTYDVLADKTEYDVGDEALYNLHGRRQGGRWTRLSSVEGVYAKNPQEAWPLLAAGVLAVCNGWHSVPVVMTDWAYDAMEAERVAEEEA